MDTQVADEFLDAIIAEVAVAAVHLERVISDAGAELCGDFLGHGGVYSFVGVV